MMKQAGLGKHVRKESIINFFPRRALMIDPLVWKLVLLTLASPLASR
jgi:hypothetical protein